MMRIEIEAYRMKGRLFWCVQNHAEYWRPGAWKCGLSFWRMVWIVAVVAIRIKLRKRGS